MTEDRGKSSVVVDLRCLQDPAYARRGVGRHALALLRHAPRHLRLVGLTDDTLPPLLVEAHETIETIHVNAYAAGRARAPLWAPASFIMMSPMTHDPIFLARLLCDPTLLRAAVVHDFIPRRSPDRYLPGAAERLRYATSLRWLARCDLFLPNSRSTANDLVALLGVPESAIAVTGCALDPAFEGLSDIARRRAPRHLLMVGGGDPRKNPEVVIRAHARSPAMQGGTGIPLVVAGHYSEENARAFRDVARSAGGRAELVEVPGELPDAALLNLYGRALALISASHDEGFSIPVIEGMAAGLPCLASDIPAHRELVADQDCLFPADNDVALCLKLERIVADTEWRAAVLARQADIWPRFSAPRSGRAVLGCLAAALSTTAHQQCCVDTGHALPCSRRFRPIVLASLTTPPPPVRSWDGWSTFMSSRKQNNQPRCATLLVYARLVRCRPSMLASTEWSASSATRTSTFESSSCCAATGAPASPMMQGCWVSIAT